MEPNNREPLTQDRIATAALELIDKIGLTEFSMRRLGATLGYEAMALYKHVDDKEELLDLAVTRVFGEIERPDTAATWQDQLRQSSAELRRAAIAHPHLFSRLATRPPDDPVALAPGEDILSGLRNAGLSDNECVHNFWVFVAYMSGALLAETAALTGAGNATLEPLTPTPEQLPEMTHLGPLLATCDFATEYAYGLEVLIQTVEQRANITRLSSLG